MQGWRPKWKNCVTGSNGLLFYEFNVAHFCGKFSGGMAAVSVAIAETAGGTRTPQLLGLENLLVSPGFVSNLPQADK